MKKTVTVTVKISEEMHREAQEALSQTASETFSRFLRGCLADLIRKNKARIKITEPIELLTIEQGQKLSAKPDN